MSYVDGFFPHRWTAGISGQSAKSLTEGICEKTAKKKKVSKKKK